jgi:hypothetical protein
MADTKTSALTTVTTPVGGTEFPVNESGTSKKITLDQIAAYDGSVSSVFAASVAAQGAGFAADTYLTGSYVKIPATTGKGAVKAQSQYRAKFAVTKTAAGTATPIITLRVGTAGTTADSSRGTLTFPAQTAVIDTGLFEVFATFRTVGSGTSATIICTGTLVHSLAATGFSTIAAPAVIATVSGGFDSTVASLGIGLSVNGGTSAAWTVQIVQAELYNLA